ncbi:MAG: Flp pilus assembly complex ATPase component TadA [Planctomycetaceae bacterium]|nr:Flp pilus assembly complex ATPase component TadA [Planctomycetota bacterium]NUN51447.1 Flp pilus assembly complex ATPase component TadA [Planctomycetaceae bacterium]
MVSFNKGLVKILKDAKAISDEDLKKVNDAAAADRGSLSAAIVKAGLMGERDLLGIIAEQVKYPPIDLEGYTPDKKVLETLSEDLAKMHGVFPVSRIGNVLTLAVSNPYDVVKLDDIRIITGCDLRLVLALEDPLKKAVERAYNQDKQAMQDMMSSLSENEDIELSEKAEEEEKVDLSAISSDADSPVVKYVNMMIAAAIKEKASDIHIEPLEKRTRVRFRNGGVMREIPPALPKKMHGAVISRIKIMADLDIAERRKPQDGKFQMKAEGRQVDFRVSILPLIHGEKVCMRLLDSGNLTLDLGKLGLHEKALTDFRAAINSPYGMVLVTGPTGSGKSTTLYSAVKELLCDEDNFVTVEDPVEYQLEGVNQVPVNPKRGLTFAGALRSILRQDPDVVMIGEIRDQETIEIAIKAALTGHLVLSTLHTNDAPGTITRIIDMGIDPFNIASATLLCSAQRLLRKVCAQCKKPAEIMPIERYLEVGFLQSEAERIVSGEVKLMTADGCAMCVNGFKGRFGVLETMPITENVKRVIIDGGSSIDIKNKAIEDGMITLRRVALLGCMEGKTTLAEVVGSTLADKDKPAFKKREDVGAAEPA